MNSEVSRNLSTQLELFAATGISSVDSAGRVVGAHRQLSSERENLVDGVPVTHLWYVRLERDLRGRWRELVPTDTGEIVD